MIFSIKKSAIALLLILSAQYVNATDIQLKAMIRTAYPENIKRAPVHGLVKYILEGTDYQIYAGSNAPDDALSILSAKSKRHNANVLMSRLDAILLAIGDKNSIILDQENKLISFTRNPIHDI